MHTHDIYIFFNYILPLSYDYYHLGSSSPIHWIYIWRWHFQESFRYWLLIKWGEMFWGGYVHVDSSGDVEVELVVSQGFHWEMAKIETLIEVRLQLPLYIKIQNNVATGVQQKTRNQIVDHLCTGHNKSQDR